jgi:hypothetical protein
MDKTGIKLDYAFLFLFHIGNDACTLIGRAALRTSRGNAIGREEVRRPIDPSA